MKNVKLFSCITIILLFFNCSNNDDTLDFEESLEINSRNECLLDCVIDDGGPGGGLFPWSNYFYTHRGETTKNIYYATSSNGANWTINQLGLGAKSSQGPASVLFNNKRFLFYKGNSSSNIFYAYKITPTSPWQGNTFINNVSKTSSSVSATVFDGKVFAAYSGESNSNLYLAYSSVGTIGNYIQVLALPVSDNVKFFSTVKNGNTMYIFWTNKGFVNGVYRERLFYRTSTNPTNSNSWSNVTILEDIPSTLSYEGGISATSLNGNIYITYGRTETFYGGTELRLLTLGKLDQNQVWSKTAYTYTLDGRCGIMVTDDSKLLLSYKNTYGGNIRTMKVDLDGTVLVSPFNSGGSTSIGGVFSYSKFN